MRVWEAAPRDKAQIRSPPQSGFAGQLPRQGGAMLAHNQGAPGKRAALFWGEEGQGNERRTAHSGVPDGMDFAQTPPPAKYFRTSV